MNIKSPFFFKPQGDDGSLIFVCRAKPNDVMPRS